MDAFIKRRLQHLKLFHRYENASVRRCEFLPEELDNIADVMHRLRTR